MKDLTLPVYDKHCSKARLLYPTFNLSNPVSQKLSVKNLQGVEFIKNAQGYVFVNVPIILSVGIFKLRKAKTSIW